MPGPFDENEDATPRLPNMYWRKQRTVVESPATFQSIYLSHTALTVSYEVHGWKWFHQESESEIKKKTVRIHLVKDIGRIPPKKTFSEMATKHDELETKSDRASSKRMKFPPSFEEKTVPIYSVPTMKWCLNMALVVSFLRESDTVCPNYFGHTVGFSPGKISRATDPVATTLLQTWSWTEETCTQNYGTCSKDKFSDVWDDRSQRERANVKNDAVWSDSSKAMEPMTTVDTSDHESHGRGADGKPKDHGHEHGLDVGSSKRAKKTSNEAVSTTRCQERATAANCTPRHDEKMIPGDLFAIPPSKDRNATHYSCFDARSGFFYPGEMDRTRCFLGGNVLHNWTLEEFTTEDCIDLQNWKMLLEAEIAYVSISAFLHTSDLWQSDFSTLFSIRPQKEKSETSSNDSSMEKPTAKSEKIVKPGNDLHNREYDDIAGVECGKLLPNRKLPTVDSELSSSTAKLDGSPSGSRPQILNPPFVVLVPREQEKAIWDGSEIELVPEREEDAPTKDITCRIAFGQSHDRTNRNFTFDEFTITEEPLIYCEAADVEMEAPPHGGDQAPATSTQALRSPPPVTRFREYTRRLRTFEDVAYFRSHLNPGADRVARAGFFCVGNGIICFGCRLRHPFTILDSANLHTIDLHRQDCQFHHIRLCKRCSENLENIGTDDEERCCACHRTLNRSVLDGIQRTYSEPLPNPGPRAFSTHQCITCYRSMDYAPHHDTCARCSGQICDECVMEEIFHRC